MNSEEKIKQIGYMPTTLEDEKITLIAEIFDLTRVNVLRNLIHSHLTMEELYKRAKELKAERGDDDAVNISDFLVGDTILL
jgi:hypothetical protein